jgi:hypothetical protein
MSTPPVLTNILSLGVAPASKEELEEEIETLFAEFEEKHNDIDLQARLEAIIENRVKVLKRELLSDVSYLLKEYNDNNFLEK